MSEYRFLYWDDLGDSQDEVDKQKKSCANHQRELDDSEREEEEAVRRMQIIMQNGNSGDGYMKLCSVCKNEKPLIDFPNNSKAKDGKYQYCRQCSNAKNKEWRSKNTEKNKATVKRWKASNKERVKEYKRSRKLTEKEKEGKKIYAEKNSEKIKEYQRDYKRKNRVILNAKEKLRKENDPVYRAICNIRTRVSDLCSAIGSDRKLSATKSIGLTRGEFKSHIESMFVDGMAWSNYGDWHIDHIKPLSIAKTEEEVMKLNHYTNLQPLWWYDNIKKRDSYSDNNYFDYFNKHQSSAEIYDDEEEQDIE